MTKDQFRTARQTLGLSTAKLGAMLGVSARTVRYYESGKRPVSGPVRKLVEILLRQV